jgi:hypothetical protein
MFTCRSCLVGVLSCGAVASGIFFATDAAIAQRAKSGYPPGLSVGTGGAYSGTGGAYSGTGGAYGGLPPGVRSGTGGAYSGTGGAYGGLPPGVRSGTGGAYSGTGGAYGGLPPGVRSGSGGAYSSTGGAYSGTGGAYGGLPSNVRVGRQPGVSHVPPYANSSPCVAPRPRVSVTPPSRRATLARAGRYVARRAVRVTPLGALGMLADYSEYVERGCN